MNHSEYLEIEESRSGLYSKFCHLRDSQLLWYESEALKLLGLKNLPSRSDKELIEQVLAKSLNDEKKKKSHIAYYIGNVVAFLKITRALLDVLIVKFKSVDNVSHLKIYNYHSLFENLLVDSLVLLNNYSEFKLKQSEIYPLGKNIQQHTSTIYQSLKQSIFGQDSFHSFKEIESDMSIAIIRQLVELRIRRAFGILAWYKPDTGSTEPLPMSVIFEVLKRHEDQIDVSMPIGCLERIYGWSNILLHSGFKDYSWNHVLVLNYLQEIALGKFGAHNMYSGISVSRAVLDEIIAELVNGRSDGAQLLKCDPEVDFVD